MEAVVVAQRARSPKATSLRRSLHAVTHSSRQELGLCHVAARPRCSGLRFGVPSPCPVGSIIRNATRRSPPTAKRPRERKSHKRVQERTPREKVHCLMTIHSQNAPRAAQEEISQAATSAPSGVKSTDLTSVTPATLMSASNSSAAASQPPTAVVQSVSSTTSFVRSLGHRESKSRVE